jgi:hypothetical protein
MGIGTWSPEYRYSGIGIYRIGNTTRSAVLRRRVAIDWYFKTTRLIVAYRITIGTRLTISNVRGE